MSRCLRMRPLLRIQSDLSPDQVVDRLQEALQSGDTDVTATVSGHYVVIRVSESRQHFGSPQLSFEVEPGESGSTLSGLFMPMPSIWTAFMALYGVIVFAGICGAVYGYGQMQVEQPPHAFWTLPVVAVLLALVYAAACIGQSRGREQMQELKQFVERSLATGS